jgi:ferredoxin
MSKIIFYRDKCVGCGICFEQQPELWRMSKKDGKATLLNSVAKKDVLVLSVSEAMEEKTRKVARECSVKIIKVI